MNFNNFTIKSQEIIQKAQTLAQELNHNQIENEHIFKSITLVDKNVIPFLFKKTNINLEGIKTTLDKLLESFAKVSGTKITLASEALNTLNNASIIANKMSDEFVSIEHIILAIFKSKSKISQALKDNGLTQKELNAAIEELGRARRRQRAGGGGR